MWNVTVPTYPADSGSRAIMYINSGIILASEYLRYATTPPTRTDIAYSQKDGHQLWAANRTLQTDPDTVAASWGFGVIAGGNYYNFLKDDLSWYAWDINTGQFKWKSDPILNEFGMFFRTYMAAYGKLISQNYDGRVYAWDLQTGKMVWNFYHGDAGLERATQSWPFFHGQAVADGKVFAPSGEHSGDSPYARGNKLFVLDVNTGKQIWNITGWYSNQGGTSNIGPIADGYLVALDHYDGMLDCFGKGQTATTVTTSQGVIANGSTVLIQGTVTDQSPGSATSLGIPVAGTPAISDQWMTPWMEYLYKQQPLPLQATGVPVKLQALRPDGTIVDIATVTSDISGNFKYLWTPPDVDCLYTIVATFDGSNSYFGSAASTGQGVVAVAPTTTTVEQPTAPDYTPLFTGLIVAVIVAIIIGIVNLFLIRKK